MCNVYELAAVEKVWEGVSYIIKNKEEIKKAPLALAFLYQYSYIVASTFDQILN